jgi:hypothetical protein
MPIHATRRIRKTRGGAHAHLLECDDRHLYVVKFRNNPRILGNGWLASVYLRYLERSTPATALRDLTAEFLAANTHIYLQLGTKVRFRWYADVGSRLCGAMMDHGYIFDPPHWTFSDSPLQGFISGLWSTATSVLG